MTSSEQVRFLGSGRHSNGSSTLNQLGWCAGLGRLRPEHPQHCELPACKLAVALQLPACMPFSCVAAPLGQILPANCRARSDREPLATAVALGAAARGGRRARAGGGAVRSALWDGQGQVDDSQRGRVTSPAARARRCHRARVRLRCRSGSMSLAFPRHRLRCCCVEQLKVRGDCRSLWEQAGACVATHLGKPTYAAHTDIHVAMVSCPQEILLILRTTAPLWFDQRARESVRARDGGAQHDIRPLW